MTRFIPSETILPSLTRTAPKTPPVQYSSDARCDSSMARRRNVLCSMFSCGLDIARFVTLFCIQKKGLLFVNTMIIVGAQLWATDVCVPISRLAECITETQKDLAALLAR